MKNTARNKQIVFFAESRKTVKLKLFLEKAKKGHTGEFLDIIFVPLQEGWNPLQFTSFTEKGLQFLAL